MKGQVLYKNFKAWNFGSQCYYDHFFGKESDSEAIPTHSTTRKSGKEKEKKLSFRSTVSSLAVPNSKKQKCEEKVSFEVELSDDDDSC